MNARIDKILGDVALFVEVAKTKSIKRAAEALGMPDSTLSRRLTELERSLGVHLLHRSTRRLELTEVGQIYYDQCRKLVEGAVLANAELKDRTENPSGTLRLSLPVDFSTLFIAPLIAEFTHLYPLIQFDLRLSEQWIDLVEQGIDIAIRLGSQADSALTIQHLGEIHYGLYASPEYLRGSGAPPPVEPSELTRHSCIRMVCPHWDDTWTLVNDRGASVRVKVDQKVAANNVGLVRRLATLGLGIAPLDHLLAQEDIDAGLLRPVLPDWRFSPVPVYALTPSKTIPAKTRVFLKFLVNRMRDKAPEVVIRERAQVVAPQVGMPNGKGQGRSTTPAG